MDGIDGLRRLSRGKRGREDNDPSTRVRTRFSLGVENGQADAGRNG